MLRVLQAGGALSLGLLLAGLGCREPDAIHEVRLAGEALGTAWSVALVIRDPDLELGPNSLRSRVAETLDRVDRGMSNWREDAEIVRFNRKGSSDPVRFSPETRRVIAAALVLARETGGSFDPTVGPLMKLWGFWGDQGPTDPDEAEQARVRGRVGWRHLAWDEGGRLVRRVPGVELDLSAIAKGYAVDAVVNEMLPDRPLGILVEVGGEVRAVGTNARGEPWRVGIEDPLAPGVRLGAVVALTGGALATSGDYRQAHILEEERRPHVMDPRSGRPVRNGVASASVLAPTCMEADAVATALMVLGAEDGLAWVEDRPWLEALLLLRTAEGSVERRASSGWARWALPEY
jgi:thiamine biosynthesis lipoprotein